jgi:hypothetical protein
MRRLCRWKDVGHGWGLGDSAEARCVKLRLREAREKNATNEESAYLNLTLY